MIEKSVNLDEFEPGELEYKAWFYCEDNEEAIDIGPYPDDKRFLSFAGNDHNKHFAHYYFNKKEVRIED